MIIKNALCNIELFTKKESHADINIRVRPLCNQLIMDIFKKTRYTNEYLSHNLTI